MHKQIDQTCTSHGPKITSLILYKHLREGHGIRCYTELFVYASEGPLSRLTNLGLAVVIV